MNNYEKLLQELLFGANELIKQTNNVNDKFDMSIRLAEQVRKAMKVSASEVEVVQQVVEEPVVEVQKQVHLALSRNDYEQVLGYKISDEAYEEYVDIFNRQANGEEINLWIPDPDGLCPIPEGARVSLAVQENPMYKHLFEEKQEEVVEEEPVVEEQEEVELPTEEEEILGGEVVEQEKELTVEEVVEQVLSEPDTGVEIDIDEDPTPKQVVAEIDGEEIDITEQFNLMKSYNKDLSYDDAVERAVEWVEFGINKETYDMLNFVVDESAEIMQYKTYLAYYIDAMSVEDIVYYINYFASNIEEDENGEEVYVNDELQLEFLNVDNIGAFLEYVQQNQQ